MYNGSSAPAVPFLCTEEFFEDMTGFCRSAPMLSHTNITSPPGTWDVLPDVQKYAPYVAVIQAVFFAVAFIWNLFILISFSVKRALLKEPACVYLFNLALTDFLLSVFVLFQCLLTEIAGSFVIGETDIVRCGTCEFLGFTFVFLMTSTLHTLAMLSFDRFLNLVKPLTYQRWFNWQRAVAIVACIWLFSLLMAIPPFFGFGEYSFSGPIANCHPQWVGKSYKGLHNFDYIVFLAVEALLPIAFLAFTNIWSYKIIRTVLTLKMQRLRRYVRSGHQETHSRQQRQLVKVFGGLFVAHVVCWTPVLTCVAVGLGIGPCRLPPEVLLTGWLLYLTNPVIHPILETFFIKDLRLRLHSARTSVRKSFRSSVSSFHGQLSLIRTRSSLMLTRQHSRSSATPETPKACLPHNTDSKRVPEGDNDNVFLKSENLKFKFTVIEGNGREKKTSVRSDEVILDFNAHHEE